MGYLFVGFLLGLALGVAFGLVASEPPGAPDPEDLPVLGRASGREERAASMPCITAGPDSSSIVARTDPSPGVATQRARESL